MTPEDVIQTIIDELGLTDRSGLGLLSRHGVELLVQRGAQAITAAVEEARSEKMCEWIDAELHDFHMMYDHLSRTYDHFSGGIISKPQTLPEEVFRVAADRQEEETQEAIKEAVGDAVEKERNAILSIIAGGDRPWQELADIVRARGSTK